MLNVNQRMAIIISQKKIGIEWVDKGPCSKIISSYNLLTMEIFPLSTCLKTNFGIPLLHQQNTTELI